MYLIIFSDFQLDNDNYDRGKTIISSNILFTQEQI